MAATIKYNAKKRTYTGTDYNDILDATKLDYVVPQLGKNKNKGLTIKGGEGNDQIVGTHGNDIIKGGIGKNIIYYSKGDGNDIIYLTKDEKFTLNMKDLTFNDLRFEYANKNKDLKIYTSKTSDEEYITLKNFAKKDITNNANTKKGITDSSYVQLVIEGKTYDLRTSKNITDNEDVVLYKTTLGENAKNFTGTWLNDEIDTKDVQLYKKVKEGKKKISVKKDITDIGLTLKGGAGNDTITGTKYSDKIYGNTGSDTINAGTGNNYIYFSKGDGNDIIEKGNGVDTLVFAKKTQLSYSYDKYDLIIKYSDSDTVTLKDYFKGHSVRYVQIGKTKTVFNPPRPQIKKSNEDGYYIFQGTDIDDTINGTVGNDKIYSNGGIDTINGKKGDDIIYCSDEEQTLEFETGSDNDIVNLGNGTQTIKLLYDNSDGVTDVIYTKEDNNLVITKIKTYNATEIETTVYKDYQGNYTLSPTTTVQNQSVVVYRDNNGNLTESSTHIESNTKVSGTYYINSSGNITTSSGSTTNVTVNNEYVNDWYTLATYSKYNNNGTIISSTMTIIPDRLGPKQIRNELSNGYEVYNYVPFNHNIYLDRRDNSYTTSSSHTETRTTYNTRIYGDVYRDYRGNYTTSSTSNVPNTKLSGYYKDYYGNYTRQTTTILDNEIMEGTYYIDLDGDIVPEKHKTTDTITVKDYFSSDFDKTNIQFNDSESINLSEYIDDKLNETYTLTDNGGNVDISSNGGVDTLIFPENIDLTYEHNLTNDDLVIRYGNSSVTLKEYFVLNHSVKNVGTLILSELMDENINEIYTLTDNGKNTEIISNGGTDTLIFPEDNDLIYEHYLVNDDLIIRYGNSSVTLKDYFISDIYSVTSIIQGNKQLFIDDEVEGYIRIIGTSDNDTIEGTTGHNIINAGEGSNIIKITSGNDEIVNGGGTDELQFNQTVNLRYYKEINSDDLIIKYNESDYVKLKDYFVNNTHSVKSILNGDENLNLLNELTTKGIKIIGSNNSDNIVGTIYDDTIESKQGIDVINGKQGNNVYKFYVNDGQNTIINDFGNDTIELPDNTDIEYHKEIDNSDLIIYYGNNDSIRLQNYFEENSHSVKTIKIGDTSDNLETVLNNSIIYIDGTEEDDTITGTIYSDFINGGSGKNTYIFNTGDGQDTIKNDTGYDTIKFEEEKVLQYHRQIGNNDLRITYGNSDSILLENYFVNNTHSVKNIINGNNELILDNVVEQQLIITGTDNNDIIKGTSGNNYIDGAGGDDTYIFNTGDGQDTIKNSLGNDIVKFEEEQNLQYYRQIGNNDLKITYGNSDSILLENYFVNNTHSVKNINNLNTNNSLENEINKGLIITDTNQNDTIEGTIGNDTYIITGGNDIILNGDGTDTIIFTNTVVLSYHKHLGSNDLTIKYNDSDSIVLKDYFVNNSHSVKNIKNENNVLVLDDEVESSLIITDTENNDEITGTSGNNTYILTGGNDIIINGTGEDVIKFNQEAEIIYKKNDNDDDLYIYHGTNYAVLKDYFVDYEHSVKTIINGTKEINIQNDITEKRLNLTLISSYISGTDYSDNMTNDTEKAGFNLGNGDDIVINNSTISYYGYFNDNGGGIYCGLGNDKIINSADSRINNIWCEEGDDTIENSGSIHIVYGGVGNDNLINNCSVNSKFVAGDGNDTVQNDGFIVNIQLDDGDDQVINNGTIYNIECGAGDDVVTNNKTIYKYTSNSSPALYTKYSEGVILGEDGNDTITNETGGCVLKIDGGNDNDIIINNGIVNLNLYNKESMSHYGGIVGGDGDDEITNNTSAIASNIGGGNGKDTIINYGYISSGCGGDNGNDEIINYNYSYALYGGNDDDIIVNEINAITNDINGDYGNDTITNKGTVTNIDGGYGDDTIINEINATTTYINKNWHVYYFESIGNDTIINKGIITNYLYGEYGNDVITNYGTVDSISSLLGNDIITNYGIVTGIINGGEGNDTYNMDITKSVKIKDEVGDEDTLNIINGNKNELLILFNVDYKGNVDSSGLKIFTTNQIETYLEDNSVSLGINIIDNYDSLETINSSDGYSITSTDIDNLRGLVASWLTSDGRNYSSVNSVLNSGNENDISALMTYFTDNTNWQKVEI